MTTGSQQDNCAVGFEALKAGGGGSGGGAGISGIAGILGCEKHIITLLVWLLYLVEVVRRKSVVGN